jgi:hypothetical protein
MGKYLHTLETLRFIRRIASLGSPDPLRTRLVKYEIRDAYLRFYFQFVAPRIQLLEQHRTERLLRVISEGFDAFVAASGFEELCRRHVQSLAESSQLTFDPEWIGQAWTRDVQLDVCAIDRQARCALVGECKWQERAVGEEVYQQLVDKAHQVRSLAGSRFTYALFSKSGFTKRLQERAAREQIHLIDLPALGLT